MKLENGLELIFVPNKSCHSVNIGLYFFGGAAHESKAEYGIHHFLEHMFFRRLSELSQAELYSSLNRIGATMRGVSYQNILRFDILVSPYRCKEALDIILKFFSDFSWSQDEVDSERQVILNQIFFSCDESFYKRTEREYLKGTGFERPIMGSEKSVKHITCDQLNALKKKFAVSENAVVVVTGNADDGFKDYCFQRFSEVEKSDGSRTEMVCNLPKNFFTRKRSVTVFPTDGDLCEIVFSFDISNDLRDKFLSPFVLQAFAVGNGAMLPFVIREEKHFTDEVYFSLEEYPSFSRGCISFLVKDEKLLPCLKETVNAMLKFKVDDSPAYFRETVPFYTDNAAFSKDNIRDYNFEIAWKKMNYNIREDFIEKEKAFFKSITVNDFNLAKANIFTSSRISAAVQCSLSSEKEVSAILKNFFKSLDKYPRSA